MKTFQERLTQINSNDNADKVSIFFMIQLRLILTEILFIIKLLLNYLVFEFKFVSITIISNFASLIFHLQIQMSTEFLCFDDVVDLIESNRCSFTSIF